VISLPHRHFVTTCLQGSDGREEKEYERNEALHSASTFPFPQRTAAWCILHAAVEVLLAKLAKLVELLSQLLGQDLAELKLQLLLALLHSTLNHALDLLQRQGDGRWQRHIPRRRRLRQPLSLVMQRHA